MPIYHGEAIVLRLLDQASSRKMTFDELGMPHDIAERFTALIERSAGMMLVDRAHGQRQDDDAVCGAQSRQFARRPRSSPPRIRSSTGSSASIRCK